MRSFKIIIAIATVLCVGFANAESIGTFGPLYQIKEIDMLDQIMAKLKEKEKSGEIKRIQEQTAKKAMRELKSPTPIAGIQRTKTPRSFYYDPSYKQETSVYAPDGRLIVPAGTTVNPFNYLNMSKHLLFIDARDSQQVSFAKKILDKYNGKAKIILVGGSWIDLMKKWEVQVFYDQSGTLSKRFAITQVPALVYQEGKRLRIDEIKL